MSRALLLPLLGATALLVASGCPHKPPPVVGPPAPIDAGAPGTPVWKATTMAKSTDLSCIQNWSCDCSAVAAAAGCTNAAVPADTSTRGVCASDNGPPQSCERCMALQPPTACECKSTCH